MVFPAVFAIVSGLSMIGYWTLTIARGQVAGPEAGESIGRGPVEMMFHYVAEFGTGICLVVAGVGLLIESGWAINLCLLSAGMLLYTVVNSSGYFAQNRRWLMPGVWAVMFVLAPVSIALVL